MHGCQMLVDIYVTYVCTHVKPLHRIIPMDDLTEQASVTRVKFVINIALYLLNILRQNG